MKKTMISLQLTEGQKAEYQKAAKQLGLSLSAFLKMGADLISNFDPAFVEEIGVFARELRLDTSLVLTHMIMKVAARNAAWLAVFGASPPGALKEFRFEGGKLVTGNELSQKLFEEYKELFEAMTKDKKIIKVKGEDYAHWSNEAVIELLGNQ